jgi:hypothetical protein
MLSLFFLEFSHDQSFIDTLKRQLLLFHSAEKMQELSVVSLEMVQFSRLTAASAKAIRGKANIQEGRVL